MNFPAIELTTSGSTLLLLVLLLAAVGLSVFVYRRTVPPVTTGWRILLISLRATALVLAILLLFEPILSLTRQKEDVPVVAVLLDNSASISLVDSKGSRADQMRDLLRQPLFREKSDFELQFFTFDNRLSEPRPAPPDTLSFSGDGTDLRTALVQVRQSLDERYLGGVLLLSDGAFNLGDNPARYAAEFPAPIYPVAIGDPSAQKDILITNHITNEIAYEGTRVPVDVVIKSSGFEGQKVNVRLHDDDKTYDTQKVTLRAAGLEHKVRLYFEPQDAGMQKFELQIDALDGELTRTNNTRVFYVKVLKSKIKLLLVAGGPSADLAFLRRMLREDENITLDVYIGKGRGGFYQGPTLPNATRLGDYDTLILLDYPRADANQADLLNLKQALAGGRSLWFISGRTVDYGKLMRLGDFLPFSRTPVVSRETEVFVRPVPGATYEPMLRLTEDELENNERWRDLPPIFSNLRQIQLSDQARILALGQAARQSGRRQALPVIATLSRQASKSAVVLGYGLWRWDLLMWGLDKTDESYRTFVRNTVRWLTTQDDNKLVKVESNKEIYRSGEQVKFSAQVYYEDFQPLAGAEVAVELQRGADVEKVMLTDIGGGRYQGVIQVLEGGDYRYTGTAHQQGRVLGRDGGQFSVEAFSLEFQDTRMNEPLLSKMAAASGGEYFTPETFGELSERLQFDAKYVTLSSEWEVWNRLPYLVTCLVLLTAEWFVRKRKGML